MTAKSLADLPDTIFCNIIECLDWGEVGRFDTASLNRNMRKSYLVALKLRKVKVERNEFWSHRFFFSNSWNLTLSEQKIK